MLDKIKEKFKKLIKINPKGGNISAGQPADDDILKELGLDDMSLLEDSDKAREKSAEFVMDEAASKKKEKSLLTLSYIVLGVVVVISVSISTILILSSSNQEDIKSSIIEQKEELQNKITELSQKEQGDENQIALTVDNNEFFKSIYKNRLKVSEIVEVDDSIIDYIRAEQNAYIKPSKLEINSESNLISMNGITNSYTNLGKIIKAYNENKTFAPISINGATKTISADGATEVPYDFELQIVYPLEEDNNQE